MKFYLCILLLLFSFGLVGQSGNNWALEGRAKMGFLLAHRGNMQHLPQEHSFAGEFTFLKRMDGSKPWHKNYHYPDIGVTAYFGSAGNAKVLGNFFGLHGFILFPAVHKEKFRMNLKAGAGIGYGSKFYDDIENPKNNAVGSHLNAMISLGLDARYFFQKSWISIGLDMTHFSNGAFQMPNLGLNLPYLSIAYGQFLRPVKKVELKEKFVEYSAQRKRRILYGVTGIVSAKEVYPTGGRKHPVFALSVQARTFLKPRMGWELAVDVFSKQSILNHQKQVSKTQSDILQVGVFTGYLLPLDRLHFVLGMGIYLRDKFRPNGLLYHRVGLRYYWRNGINANLVLKSHWAKADYIEFGIGYTFNYRKK